MNYNTVYVGMDVHKETFSLCCYTNEKELAEYSQKVDACKFCSNGTPILKSSVHSF